MVAVQAVAVLRQRGMCLSSPAMTLSATSAPRRSRPRRSVRGVEKDKPRVLVGNDAYRIDWIARLLQSRYTR